MGLDCSHDAFHGAYSAFNRLRQAVAKAAGGSFPPHENPDLDPSAWYWEGGIYSREAWPGLYEFLTHSDCDGEIERELCKKVADELQCLQPKVGKLGGGGGHIESQGGYGVVLQRFIDGCRLAIREGEDLRFE